MMRSRKAKIGLALVLLAMGTQVAAQEHVHEPVPAAPEHQHEPEAAPPVPAPPHDHSAAQPALVTHEPASPAMQQAEHMNRMMHGASLNWLLMADRLELTQHDDVDVLQWELQGWIGQDEHKLWIKSEGERDQEASETEYAEVQLLYSHALAPYWDLQAGLRHDDGANGTRSHLVLGLMGLAPYWFETDAALFFDEQGQWSARLEVEYELRFTQRLILQPRLELNYAAHDDPNGGVRQGFNDSSLGLRLRYEIKRELAPYVGVEWWQARGSAGAALRQLGQDDSDARVVAGFRLWY
jgi:copper resistance protein B